MAKERAVGYAVPRAAAAAYQSLYESAAALTERGASPEVIESVAEGVAVSDLLVEQVAEHHTNLVAADLDVADYESRMDAHPAYQRLLRLEAEAFVTVEMAQENIEEQARREKTLRADLTAPIPSEHGLPPTEGFVRAVRELEHEKEAIRRVYGNETAD